MTSFFEKAEKVPINYLLNHHIKYRVRGLWLRFKLNFAHGYRTFKWPMKRPQTNS